MWRVIAVVAGWLMAAMMPAQAQVQAQARACPLADDLVRRYGISVSGFEREIPAVEAGFGGGDEQVVQVPLNGRGDILDGYSHLAFVHTLSKQAWILRSGGYAGVREWFGPVSVDLALLTGCAGAEAPLAGELVAPVRCVSTEPDAPQRIRISVDGRGQLQMDSELRWDGGRSMGGEPYRNFGGLRAALHVAGATASAADDYCKVAMTLLGRILVVNDNGACGGINVRHLGMYVRE